MAIVPIADYESFLGVASGDTLVAALARPVERAIKRWLRYDPEFASRIEFYPKETKPESSRGGALWDSDGSRAFLVPRLVGNRTADRLQLKHIPIRGVSAVEVREQRGALAGQRAGSFAAETVLVSGDQYWVDITGADGDGLEFGPSGLLVRRSSVWPHEMGSIQVSYDAGYTAEEFADGDSSLVDASSIALAAKMLLQKVYITVKSQCPGGVSLVPGLVTAGPKMSERAGEYSYTVDSILARAIAGLVRQIPGEIAEMLSDFVHYGFNAA